MYRLVLIIIIVNSCVPETEGDQEPSFYSDPVLRFYYPIVPYKGRVDRSVSPEGLRSKESRSTSSFNASEIATSSASTVLNSTSSATNKTKSADDYDFENKTVCSLSSNDFVLRCFGPLGSVFCSVDSNFNKSTKYAFAGFGLSLPIRASKTLEEQKYRMYPFITNNGSTYWFDNMFRLNEDDVEYSLYSKLSKNETNNFAGIQVKEVSCFNKLNDMFSLSNKNYKIKLANSKLSFIFGKVYIQPKFEIREFFERFIGLKR